MSITLAAITPVSATNLIYNPSAESAAASTWSAVGGATVTRSTTYSRQTGYNATYSFRVQTDASAKGIQYTTPALANTAHYVTVWVTGTLPASGLNAKIGTTTTALSLLETITVGAVTWRRYGAAFTGAQVSAQTAVQVLQNGTGSGDFYLDDAQLEATSYYTTAFNGSFNGSRGFRWNGVAHQSTSTMHPRLPDGSPNLAGGRVYTLNADNILVSSALGLGVPPVDVVSQSGAEEGGIYQSTTVNPRAVTLELTLKSATGQAGLHATRDTLIDTIQLGEPFTLQYTGGSGAAFPFALTCVYVGGLEGHVELPTYEKVTLQLLALDPRVRAPIETATTLNMASSFTLAFVAAKQQGVWSCPGGGLPFSNLRTVAVSPQGHVIAAGMQTPGTSIVYGFNGTSWGTIAVTTGGVGFIHAAAFDPSGAYCYLGGDFTQMAGVANTAYIARYALPVDGVTGGTVTALGTGANGAVRALVVDPANTLYAFGDFTTMNGGAANYAAAWTGSAWGSIALNTAGTSSTSAANGVIHCASVAANGDIIVGGDFLTLGTGLTAPTPTAALVSGGAMATSSVKYTLRLRTGDGRTAASTASNSVSPISSTKAVTVTWATPGVGTSAIEIYRQDAGTGNYNYLTTVGPSVTSYTDDGSLTPDSAIYDNLYATNDGARTARVARYDKATGGWRSLGASGMSSGVVRGITYLGDEVAAVAVGSFVNADGQPAYQAALYNGQTWVEMGKGLRSGLYGPYGVVYHPGNGRVYALGDFSFDLCDDIAVWAPGTGGAGYWTHADLSAPSNTVFLAGAVDPNGDLWIVGDTQSTATAAAATTVTVTQAPGVMSYPRLYITGPGTFRALTNWTTGQELRFNLSVAAGEVVTLDFRPHRKTITSTYKSGARRANTLLDGPFGAWGLVGGANVVTVLYTGTTAASSVRLVDPEARISADVQ